MSRSLLNVDRSLACARPSIEELHHCGRDSPSFSSCSLSNGTLLNTSSLHFVACSVGRCFTPSSTAERACCNAVLALDHTLPHPQADLADPLVSAGAGAPGVPGLAGEVSAFETEPAEEGGAGDPTRTRSVALRRVPCGVARLARDDGRSSGAVGSELFCVISSINFSTSPASLGLEDGFGADVLPIDAGGAAPASKLSRSSRNLRASSAFDFDFALDIVVYREEIQRMEVDEVKRSFWHRVTARRRNVATNKYIQHRHLIL